MEASRHLENNEEIAVSSERPVDIKAWNKDHVRQWMLDINVDTEDADILHREKINGSGLLHLKMSHLTELKLSMNAKVLIIENVELLKQKTQQQNDVVTQCYSSKPYPFNRFHAAHRYRENSILDVTESGPIDLIQPCHEFKAFTNTTEENRMKKYTYEVIRFAAACMNSRTNGTIHFGVANKPHGQIQGVSIQITDDLEVQQSHAIKNHFKWDQQIQIAKRCIKPPRFVEVLKADMTSAGKYVIEVDVEPSSIVCEEFHFKTYNVDKNNKQRYTNKKVNDGTSFFIRDGSSTKDLNSTHSSKEYDNYITLMSHLSQLRKDAEEKHLSFVKHSVQGSKLCEMITGGTQSLDRSHFTSYIVVANKSHPVQMENLDFIHQMNQMNQMNLMAVLDFDPQSAEYGLNKFLKEKKKFNLHLPAQYKITGPVEDIASRLKLTKNTSWVFCNGGINEETPSDVDKWLIEKGSSVRDVVSFLCRKDVLHQRKLLTIFLLLSQVNDGKDPLLETFSMFLQELKGENQILCISDNETTYTYWKDLIKGRYGVDISKRCIYELSVAEVNGTILSLWSENRKSKRFLPGGGGSKVVLSKKTEESLETLSVLCVNQCDGGNEDRQHHEENFYKGGKVSWWNFHFSEQPGSVSVIKRDKFDYIVNTIIPDIRSRKRACEFFNIFHLPNRGGSTLAMNVLWTLKDKFRCAVLKDTTQGYSTIAEQVVQLLTYETNEQDTRLPVLIMIDDFKDIDEVKKLQDQIEEECSNQNIFSKFPQVIIVNCMKVERDEGSDDAVFIGYDIYEKEQKQIDEKLKEIKNYKNGKEFHGFMNLFNNSSPHHFQNVVKNTLSGFNFQHKQAQLFAVLVLLQVYCKNASLSVSTCEEFLGLQTKADSESCKVEDGFDKFSTLLTRCTVVSNVTFEGVRVIHSSIAQHCLKELSTSHGVSKAKITNLLLTTDLFFEYTLGKQKLMQDVHNMLVKRQYSDEIQDSLFSPLIQDVMKETPGMEETVLLNAAERYRKDAVIFQLLARHYIKKQDFTEAMIWAKKTRDPCDTVSQTQLKHTFDEHGPMKQDSLDKYLKFPESATGACKETQQTADKEKKKPNNYSKDLSSDNSYITVSHVLVCKLKHAFHEDKDDPIKPDSLDRYLTLAESAAEACIETQHTADKEAKNRLERKNDYNTYNTAGHLGELETAATVIKILQKTGFTSNNHLAQVLSGKTIIEDFSRKKPEHKQYSDVLQKHRTFLLQLKDRMKQHFVFFNNFFVNLVPFFSGKDKQKELTMRKVSRYFQHYIGFYLFSEVKINWSKLVNTRNMNTKVKIEQTRQCLERNKGDSYTGLLEYLYEEESSSTLEEIVQQYEFILRSQDNRDMMDTVNFIYANVILANINPESKHIKPYKHLHKLLLQIIERTRSFKENLPLHYITVLLLWQEKNSELPTFVSQMKTSYSSELKPVSNGKRAAVHFYLGKDKGYGGLISQRDINSCLGSGQNISTQWDDEKIWKKVRESKKLKQVSGEIRDNLIWVADEKVMVDPMLRSQLRKESGTRVKFFIGFSMNGPVALDIHLGCTQTTQSFLSPFKSHRLVNLVHYNLCPGKVH